MKKIGLIAIIIILICSMFCIPAFAETTANTMNLMLWGKCTDTNPNESYGFSVVYYYPRYNGVDYYNYYTIYDSNDKDWYIVYLSDDSVINSSDKRYLLGGTAIVIKFTDNTTGEDDMKNFLFNENTDRIAKSVTIYTTDTSYQMISTKLSNWIKNLFDSTNHADTYYLYFKNLNPDIEPPKLEIETGGDTGGNGDTEEDDEGGLLGALKEILELLKNLFKFQQGTLIFDKAAELINDNLKDNKFFTSVTSIKNTLESLFEEDYTDPEGFYKLGLTNFTLKKPAVKITGDFGNEVIGQFGQTYTVQTSDINYGIENVQLLNLDWFFGKKVGTDGSGTVTYYTEGVKEYSDKIIGAFMWLTFGWWLWHNLPDMLMGDLGAVGDLTNRVRASDEKAMQEAQRQIEKEQREEQRQAEREEREARRNLDRINREAERNSYEAYKEKQDRAKEYKERYRKENGGKKQ